MVLLMAPRTGTTWNVVHESKNEIGAGVGGSDGEMVGIIVGDLVGALDGFVVGGLLGNADGDLVGDGVAIVSVVGHEHVLFQNSGHDPVAMVMDDTEAQFVTEIADDHPNLFSVAPTVIATVSDEYAPQVIVY